MQTHLQRFVIRLTDGHGDGHAPRNPVMLELKLENLNAKVMGVIPETCVLVCCDAALAITAGFFFWFTDFARKRRLAASRSVT